MSRNRANFCEMQCACKFLVYSKFSHHLSPESSKTSDTNYARLTKRKARFSSTTSRSHRRGLLRSVLRKCKVKKAEVNFLLASQHELFISTMCPLWTQAPAPATFVLSASLHCLAVGVS